MKGKILDYNFSESTGVISGEDGSRYNFKNEDWKSKDLPKSGMNIDFVGSDGVAKEIYTLGMMSTISKPSMDGFYRIVDQSFMGGVCAGAAHKWGSSRTGLRWATVIMSLLFILPMFVYLCLWMVLPKVDSVEADPVSST